MMLQDTGTPALITLNFSEDFSTSDGEYIMDPHCSPRSETEMYSLIDRAAMCASKRCRDLFLPFNTRDVKEKIRISLLREHGWRSRQATLYFSANDVEFAKLVSYLTFRHQSIHQFAEEKAKDDTFSDMAGRNFDSSGMAVYFRGNFGVCVKSHRIRWSIRACIMAPARYRGAPPTSNCRNRENSR